MTWCLRLQVRGNSTVARRSGAVRPAPVQQQRDLRDAVGGSIQSSTATKERLSWLRAPPTGSGHLT